MGIMASRRAAWTLAALALVAAPAAAQEFPEREIRVICGYEPGTGADIMVRYFADKLRGLVDKPVLVENRGGALTAIAADMVARSKPDGHTLFITAGNSTFAANVHLFKQLAYDPVKDFTPVTTLVQLPFLLTVNPKLPVASVGELTAHLKARRDKASYGFPNTFSLAAAELYKTMAGLETVQVAYKATPTAVTDLLNNELDFIFLDASFGAEQARSGRIRALAATGPTRLASLPDVPTMVESGVPGYELTAWWGAWLPAGAPPAVVDRLAGWLNRIVASEETKAFTFRIGAEPWAGNARLLGEHLARDTEKWGAVLKAAKVEPQ